MASAKRGTKAAAAQETAQAAASPPNSHAARLRGNGDAAQQPLPKTAMPDMFAMPASDLRDAQDDGAGPAGFWHHDPLGSDEEEDAAAVGGSGSRVVSPFALGGKGRDDEVHCSGGTCICQDCMFHVSD